MTDISLSPEAVEVQAPPIPEPPDNSRIEFTHNMRVYAFWSSSGAAEANGYSPEERWRGYGRNAVWMTWADMVADFGTSLRSLVLLKPYFPPEPLELTPEERAAKEKSEHMSTCHEEACVDCMKELRAIRRTVKAIRPHIAALAREDERRKLYPAVVQRLLDSAAWYAPVGLADPAEISATDLAIAEAFRSEAKAWQKAVDDGSPVAAASNPTDTRRPDTEGGVDGD